MNGRKTYTLAASTLVEMLVVIIVSGVLFIALFDGVDLVKRYTNRLNRKLATGNTLLDRFQQLDYLFQSCDSVSGTGESFQFYRDGDRQALVERQDSFLFCSRASGVDTLFWGVEKIHIVAVKDQPELVDSLGVQFRYRGRLCYFEFGTAKRSEREWDEQVREVENQFKEEDYDGMEQ